MAKYLFGCLLLCCLSSVCISECTNKNSKDGATLIWKDKKYECNSTLDVVVKEGDVVYIEAERKNHINHAWCLIGNKKYDLDKLYDCIWRTYVTISTEMSTKWIITSLANVNTTNANFTLNNMTYISTICVYNIKVTAREIMTKKIDYEKELWIYFGVAALIVSIIIIAQIYAIVYYKKKGALVSRLDQASASKDTTKTNNRARYIISPHIMGLLTRKEKREQNVETDDDSGSLYETLEDIALGSSDTPLPPPITTLPKPARKFLGVDTPCTIEEKKESKSPTKKNPKKDKEVEIKNRAPLPLPHEMSNEAPPKNSSVKPPTKQKSTLSEKSIKPGKACSPGPSPKLKTEQEVVSQALNDIFKNRSDSILNKQQQKPTPVSKSAMNRKPTATNINTNPSLKVKPKPPVKKPDIVPKSFLTKVNSKRPEPTPQAGPSAVTPQSTLRKHQPIPNPINKPPMPPPPTVSKATPPPSPPPNEVEDIEQEIYTPWGEDWTYESLQPYQLYSNLQNI
ncbi:proteoglycan 4-like [Galleria mellonella]|uniref:Proteoglycan 4-like n=1 Tax=Galleria mellonella TaxID=7137 RepID=A0ABM3MD41_GALME|nr:proteoglycan 4-like [Galleria mellonella]